MPPLRALVVLIALLITLGLGVLAIVTDRAAAREAAVIVESPETRPELVPPSPPAQSPAPARAAPQADAINARAHELYDRGAYAQALSEFQRAAAMGNTDAPYWVGACRSQLGRSALTAQPAVPTARRSRPSGQATYLGGAAAPSGMDIAAASSATHSAASDSSHMWERAMDRLSREGGTEEQWEYITQMAGEEALRNEAAASSGSGYAPTASSSVGGPSSARASSSPGASPTAGVTAGDCPKGGSHVPGKTDSRGRLHCAKCGRYM